VHALRRHLVDERGVHKRWACRCWAQAGHDGASRTSAITVSCSASVMCP